MYTWRKYLVGLMRVINISMKIEHIFTVPIATAKLPTIPEETVSFAKSIEYIPYAAGDVDQSTLDENVCDLLISKNKQVLDFYPELKDLRDVIYTAACEYWHNDLGVSESLKIRIRHSWITKHRPGNWNRPHTHTTSTFSSCVYLQTAENCGDLVFRKDTNYLNLFPSALDFDYQLVNNINRKEYSVTPEDSLIVCFPSHLNHYTKSNNSNMDRYTINIDWWFYGISRKGSRGGFQSEFN
jgi:uncharacterized protein (TIGR02466 family)